MGYEKRTPQDDPPGSRKWSSINAIVVSRFGKDAKDPTKRENYRTAWRYLYRRGLSDGFNIMADNPSIRFVAITMAWMERVLMDAEQIKVQDICDVSGSTLDEFLEWEQSDLGKYTKRVDSAIARERLDGATRRVLKKIVDWVVDKNDKKAAEMYLRATGQLEGVKDNTPGLPVKVIQEYVMGGATAKEVPQAKTHKPELSPQGEAVLRVEAKLKPHHIGSGGSPIVDHDRGISTVDTPETLERRPNRHVDRKSAHLREIQALHQEEP